MRARGMRTGTGRPRTVSMNSANRQSFSSLAPSSKHMPPRSTGCRPKAAHPAYPTSPIRKYVHSGLLSVASRWSPDCRVLRPRERLVGLPSSALHTGPHLCPIGVRFRRMLPLVTGSIAVPAGSHNVGRGIRSAATSGNEVLSSASQLTGAALVVKPHAKAAVEAQASLALVSEKSGALKCFCHVRTPVMESPRDGFCL